MAMKLYNKAVGIPAALLKWLPATFDVRYSNHALQASQDDRYGHIALPARISLEAAHVVEVETEDGKISKVVARQTQKPGLDIVFVLIPSKGAAFVKTVWFNETSDNHATLDRSKITGK